MAHIVEISNPFEPMKDTRRCYLADEITLRAWFKRRFGDKFVEFDRPTLVLINGEPSLRAEWDVRVLKRCDVVNVITLQQGLETILLVVVLVVAVAAIALTLVLQPPRPGETPEADPVYDLRGQRNQIRLGNPIEVPYGRCRLWPSYAARAYNKFFDNDQYQYQLFCLGQGEFDVEQLYIEDTPIESFSDVEFEFYAPGEEVTLFPDNVITSVEVGDLELYGPDQAEYTAPGDGYVANPEATLTNYIEVDLTFPQGLYYANTDGSFGSRTVAVTIEARTIDDDGDPIGSWTTIVAFSKTLATNTPQRFTAQLSLTSGRYAVRAYRTTTKGTDSRSITTVKMIALRAFLPSTKDYGDVTLLAVKSRANNNLNDRASNRVNLFATRKLRTWDADTETWTAPVATRSIVWAFVDVFQAAYGARLADQYLNLQALAELDEVYTARGEHFDYVFDQRQTVWDAARTIARCGRAVPMLNGSQVTMIRDAPKTVATAVFNPDNILADSFRIETKLSNALDNDGVEIEYTDPDTWKPETMLCLMPGDTGDDPQQVKLPGCANRAHAYREGLYIRATQRYLRQNVRFNTGLEGHIPSYGDLIYVSHDLPRWGVGGIVLSRVGNVLTLSEDLEWTPSAVHKLVLRNKNGAALGPYTVTQGEASNQVVLTDDPDISWGFNGINEKPFFMFGTSENWGQRLLVVGITPSDEDTVEIRCSNYSDEVHDYDDATPPALEPPEVPPSVPALPVVTTGYWEQTQFTVPLKGSVVWGAALGATYYVVQRRIDATTWVTIGETSELRLDDISVPLGTLFFRVAGVNLGVGPYHSIGGLAEV